MLVEERHQMNFRCDRPAPWLAAGASKAATLRLQPNLR